MKKLIFFLLGFSLIANADRSEDLFAENQKSKSYIKSFYMDCSTASPLCIEREEALRAERRFNDIFETEIVNVVDFGVFVKVHEEIDGMIHISQTKQVL